MLQFTGQATGEAGLESWQAAPVPAPFTTLGHGSVLTLTVWIGLGQRGESVGTSEAEE